jgi:branched-chain amino acid transport system ATP-binding protein
MQLEVINLRVVFNKAMILNDINLSLNKGELVGLVGPNGAGKSTALKAISGLITWRKKVSKGIIGGDITIDGLIVFDGKRIDEMPAHKIVSNGLVLCPERRKPFREMTVLDNLLAGAFLERKKAKIKENLDIVYQLFPKLKSRNRQISGTLSGGEQQMLAIGRALMSQPRLLCIDEPSIGLAPIVRAEVFEKIMEINKRGISILLVEQEISTIFKMTSRNYVISSGQIIIEGTSEKLLNDDVIRKIYLGM